ncbi:MAG TPA: hypothetical protein HPP57_03830, partial [Deltaproteobacteria bacterium]|nr:hypothetical protein [Deltaproteobacteria bacterium]
MVFNGPHTVLGRAGGVFLRIGKDIGADRTSYLVSFCRTGKKNSLATGVAWFSMTFGWLPIEFIELATFMANHDVVRMPFGFSQQIAGEKIIFGSAFRTSLGFHPKEIFDVRK